MNATSMLSGALAACWFVAGLFFLRFWRQTRDSFFLYFTAAFWLEAISRVVAALMTYVSEDEPIFYGVRLVSYGLVILAIWQKNRPRPASRGETLPPAHDPARPL